MFKVVLSARAKKELKLLKLSYRQAIGHVLEEIKEGPLLGKPLNRELIKKFSFRIGVYRIIYKVNFEDEVITVLSAGHRGVVYK